MKESSEKKERKKVSKKERKRKERERERKIVFQYTSWVRYVVKRRSGKKYI